MAHVATASVIVDDFDVFDTGQGPAEADAPLVVDSDAELADTPALQRLQPVARRHSQVAELTSNLELPEFPPRSGIDARGDTNVLR
jgi:hypothetical protein